MCSRVLWNDKEKVATARVGGRKVPLAVVGRVMDWAFDEYKADLWILPPGGKRDGRTKLNPIRWPIKYGSLVVPVSWPVMRNGKQVEVATSTDGINQKGLAGHTLWLGRTKYPELDGTKPTLNIAIWLQYYLDQFATVEEALKDAKKRRFHLVPVPIGKIGGKLHLTLEDRSGSSAVIEYVDGEQHAHKGPGYSVVTNSLSCDMQRDADYEEYKEQFQRGRIRLPTTTNSNHRFVRAKHYLEHLPKATDERETVAYLMSVLRNVSYPFGGSDPLVPQDEAIPSTRWRSAINLPQSVYYFESTTRPNIFWVVISDLKFGTFQKLDLPGRPDPVGNVASQFAEVPESFAWPEPEDVVPAEALHSAGRQVEKLLIIGGGPKAAAVCAKCCILRDLDLPAPKPVVFEQHVLAAAWTGRHGYTTGTLRLGTSPEKDVGFPYFEDSKNAQVTSELFRRFSWTNYLRKLGTFAEWIDRGRPHPTHKQYSDYISWVITNSIQKDEKIIGTVQEIHPQNGGWRVVVQIGDQRKEFEGDKLLVTGTGKAKRPEFEFPRDKNILFGDNFWTEENLKLLDGARRFRPNCNCRRRRNRCIHCRISHGKAWPETYSDYYNHAQRNNLLPRRRVL